MTSSRGHFLFPTIVLSSLLGACGGDVFSASNGAGAGDAAAGSAGAGGGDTTGGSSSGGTAAGGGAGLGGAMSNGGTVSGGTGGTATGGAPSTGCTVDTDCPQPGAPCSYALCVRGTCEVRTGTGCNQCASASDCPAPPPSCTQCPDGSSVCLGVDCVSGQCVPVNDSCPTPTAGCPTDAPTDGSPCAYSAALNVTVADCSWGDDPRVECRTTATCQAGGTWSVTHPDQTACATDPLPSACPSLPPSGDCTGTEPTCWYESGEECFCSSCAGGSSYPSCTVVDPPQWACLTPPAGCPTMAPQAGTPCDQAGLNCSTDCNLTIICDQGTWHWGASACAICAAPDTPIATPTGERPIASLRVGDLVYSVEGGAVVVVPIARAESTPVHGHRVMRVQLDGGVTLEISPGHPTADGRTFGELEAGDTLDAAHGIAAAALVPYAHERTYDILPASDTGAYFAGGALIGSTLRDGERPTEPRLGRPLLE